MVGAGIVGASCAWHLRRRGARVTVIDPQLPGQSTSFGNAGCISVSSIAPFSYPGAIRKVPGWLRDPLGPMRIRWQHGLEMLPWFYRFWRAGNARRVTEIATAQQQLMSTVIDDYDEILAATGSEKLRRANGMILLYGNEQEFADDAWHYDIREQFGLPWQRLTAAELRSMEPAVQLGKGGIAVLDPLWQHLRSPADVTRHIAEAAFDQGASWLQDRVSAVTASEQGVSVDTLSGQRLAADYLVVAAGVWSNDLLRQLGHHVPLMAKRGYHSMLSQPNVELSRPLMQIGEYIVITPMRDGLRVAGTAEFARVDAPADYRRAKALLQHARRFLPEINGAEVTEWMGQRPMMPDSMPVIGPLPGHARVLCALGHGHYGITQGPTSGRIIAKLVFNEPPHIDLSPFAADRF